MNGSVPTEYQTNSTETNVKIFDVPTSSPTAITNTQTSAGAVTLTIALSTSNPSERIKLNKTTIRIVSRFVKGRYVNLHEQLLIKKYVVDRVNKPDSEYSFQDYHPNNYIIEREKPYNIYVIDLEDYRRISLKERQDKWNTQWRQDKFKEYNKLYYRSK